MSSRWCCKLCHNKDKHFSSLVSLWHSLSMAKKYSKISHNMESILNQKFQKMSYWKELITFTFSHLADAFIQSDFTRMYTHFTLMAHCTSGAIRGSVSCSRSLRQGIELTTLITVNDRDAMWGWCCMIESPWCHPLLSVFRDQAMWVCVNVVWRSGSVQAPDVRVATRGQRFLCRIANRYKRALFNLWSKLDGGWNRFCTMSVWVYDCEGTHSETQRRWIGKGIRDEREMERERGIEK